MERTGREPSWRSAVGPALGIWWASRLALFVVVVLVGYVQALPGPTRIHQTGGWLLERFVWWDSFHFLRIADRGYLPPGLPCCDQAFFPGYPFATRAASLLTGGSTVVAGLLVTQLAASIAAVLLHRVAAESAGSIEGPRVGRTAVLLLAVSPFSLFLSSVYSEALFLAACLGAWWAGSHRRWWWAGVLAAAAATVRINGLFLAAALVVMYLVQLRADGRLRPRPDLLALVLPGAVVAGYFGYLHARTGSWNDWQQAQVISWERHVAWPWQGLQAGWQSLLTAPSNDLVISRAADLVTALGGLALLALLLARRRWAEATFIALNVGVLVCSTMIVSSPRYALTWFPLYLMAARISARPAGWWVRPLALTLGPPLLAVASITFSMHLWVA
ncbi:MAG TPA: mannosyltransferase family protein [Kineosporiaceae bacterium]|nr:mannosyltransferase family protein [Kineosporiaceae bacterium]